MVMIVILVGLLSFALGRLSVFYDQKDEFRIIYPEGQSVSAVEGAVGIALGGGYVGSRTGSTYLFPWCAAARSIKSGNKLFFTTRAEAERAGYSPGNCSGLKQ